MRLFIAQCNPILGDFDYNTRQILHAISEAKQAACDMVVFSELAVCGYSPEDLLLNKRFVENAENALVTIAKSCFGITVIVGTVRENVQLPGKPLCNSAAVIYDGQIVGYQDKCLLPTYDVFDEWRYFEPAKSERIWTLAGKKIGLTICEDIWPAFDPFLENRYKDDPLECFEDKNLDLLINISASPYSLGKIKTRMLVAKKVAKRLKCPVALVNQVGAQDGLLFDGSSFVVSQYDELLAHAKSFLEDAVIFDLQKPHLAPAHYFDPGHELFMALSMGVKDYFHKQGFTKACLGLSGGIDSSVVAAIAVDALGKDNVLAFFMPSRFSSHESREDAFAVAKNLGIELHEVPIEPALEAFLDTLGLSNAHETFGVVEENLQSRVRGVLLMALSNKTGCLVLNTGNKSEVAMGYTTLYGDSVGAIGVIGDLLKRQVVQVGDYINKAAQVILDSAVQDAKAMQSLEPESLLMGGEHSQEVKAPPIKSDSGSRDYVDLASSTAESRIIPERVFARPPSAELRFNQKDTDTLPEYPILDTIVEDYVVHHKTAEKIAKDHGYNVQLVADVLQKIHQNEYKRRQLPLPLRISEKAFAIGRKVPIVSKIS